MTATVSVINPFEVTPLQLTGPSSHHHLIISTEFPTTPPTPYPLSYTFFEPPEIPPPLYPCTSHSLLCIASRAAQSLI